MKREEDKTAMPEKKQELQRRGSNTVLRNGRGKGKP